MLDELEDRLRYLEESVGLGEERAVDLDIVDLKNTLVKKGFNHVLKVDIQKLRQLKAFVDKPENRPLSEKITFVQCCADITKRRAELLQEFEDRLKVVLNTDDLAGIQAHEAQLQPIANDIDAALQIWKKNTAEIEEFRKEYTAIMTSLQEYVQQLADKVEQAEAKHRRAAAANTSEA